MQGESLIQNESVSETTDVKKTRDVKTPDLPMTGKIGTQASNRASGSAQCARSHLKRVRHVRATTSNSLCLLRAERNSFC
jgi:hypothetical protein